jgi:uncharacterized protein
MRIAVDGPKPVVIDEFPFLAKATPALPSLIQRALEPAAQRRGTPVRLLLCGSALGFMGKLLAGNAPLRGRAGLELVVRTLDFRLAREFWEIADLRTAVLTNAIVGGTPAYRREFVQDDSPANADDFDAWVCRTVLSPGRPLFREARYILAEELDLHDTALYHAVLAAIAEGNITRGGIASYLGRKSTDLAHPLGVLHDAGLITHETEAFKRNRSAYRIAEPLLTFYHAIMRSAWGDLERPGRAAQVWQRSQHTFHANVVGPHFEEICRQWARWHAGPETYGGAYPVRVASGTVSDPDARKTAEIDVAIFGRSDGDRDTLLAIGEVKWQEHMTTSHLKRLQHVRDLLWAKAEPGAKSARLLLFSSAGFSAGLLDLAAQDSSFQLIGLDRLYYGSLAGSGGRRAWRRRGEDGEDAGGDGVALRRVAGLQDLGCQVALAGPAVHLDGRAAAVARHVAGLDHGRVLVLDAERRGAADIALGDLDDDRHPDRGAGSAAGDSDIGCAGGRAAASQPGRCPE